MHECDSILHTLLCSHSPVSLASVHDLFIVIVFHVVEQDLVEPGTRHGNGIMTRLLSEHVPHNYNEPEIFTTRTTLALRLHSQLFSHIV